MVVANCVTDLEKKNLSQILNFTFLFGRFLIIPFFISNMINISQVIVKLITFLIIDLVDINIS